MENANKYRIKVEAINGNDEELLAVHREGIDCDGFVIIGDRKDSSTIDLRKIAVMDIAMAIAKDDNLLRAACVAIGIEAGMRLTKARKVRKPAINMDGLPGFLDMLIRGEDDEK